MNTWICTDNGCDWYPLAMRYDEETSEIVMIAPEPYPGTIEDCTVTQMINNEDGCDIPYAATYGAGDLFEDPGWEDWADSLAAYVYPEYFTIRGRTALQSGGLRERYIEEQIEAIP